MTNLFSLLLPTRVMANSSMVTVALISVVIAGIVSIVIRAVRRHLALPPGPWFIQLTLLRTLVMKSMGETGGQRLDKLYEMEARKRGKIFSYRMLGDLFVVLNDPAIIREAFAKQRASFSDRRYPTLYSRVFGGANAHRVLFGNDRPWKTARRLVSPCLKNIGSWGQRMESVIQLEGKCLNDKLAAYETSSFDPRNDITTAVANIIYNLVHGQRLEYGDARLQELINAVTIVTDQPTNGSDMLRYLPFHFISRAPRFQPIIKAMLELRRIMSTAVSEQIKTYDSANATTTIIERIIQAAEKAEEVGEDVEGYDGLQKKEAWRLLLDIMIAGSDTTANTLKWIVLAMAHYPGVQKKVHDEIDDVLGDRIADSKDQKLMPYTQATIMEMLRSRPVLPVALPHFSSQTTVLEDYTIPKGTIIIANVWACHHDPEYWSDPEAFEPERFLSEDGKSLGPDPPAYMPFSVGPRMCAGDQLARTELFLVFTSIMQRFNIEYGAGARPSTFDDGLLKGLMLRPNAMNIRMTARSRSDP